MTISKKLLDILCCPVCKNSLKEDSKSDFLICEKCKIKYPVKDGIPILLAEEGIKFEQDRD